MQAAPTFSEAMVLSQHPRGGINVVLASGQVPAAPVKALHHGAADGVAVDKHPAPRPGTWGLVAFPGGDVRNGVWLGSLYLSDLDAIPTDTDSNMCFHSYWSGAYEMLDGEGRYTKYMPDGTYFTISDTTSKPTIYKHVVDAQQNRVLTPFPDADRTAAAVSPRHVYLSHASGTTVHIDPSGNTSVTGASGATCTLTFNGGSISLNAAGAITENVPAGQQITLSAGGASASFSLVRTDLLLAWLNNHLHYNGNGGANTGVPTSLATAAGIQSTLTKISA